MYTLVVITDVGNKANHDKKVSLCYRPNPKWNNPYIFVCLGVVVGDSPLNSYVCRIRHILAGCGRTIPKWKTRNCVKNGLGFN